MDSPNLRLSGTIDRIFNDGFLLIRSRMISSESSIRLIDDALDIKHISHIRIRDVAVANADGIKLTQFIGIRLRGSTLLRNFALKSGHITKPTQSSNGHLSRWLKSPWTWTPNIHLPDCDWIFKNSRTLDEILGRPQIASALVKVMIPGLLRPRFLISAGTFNQYTCVIS